MHINTGQVLRLILIALPLLSVTVSMIYAANVPYFDDYNLVLQFLSEYAATSDWTEKIKMLCVSSNGHRIIFFRMMILADHHVFGSVDFRHFILLANLAMMGIIFLCWKIYSNIEPTGARGFLPVLLLLSVPSWAVINWSSAGVTYVFMIFCMLASMYALHASLKGAFVISLLLACTAVITNGAGWLIFAAALPILRAKYTRGHQLVWWLFFSIVLVLYFQNYFSPDATTDIFEQPLWHWIINTLAFFGAPFKALYGTYHHWNLLFGSIFLATATFIFYHKWQHLKAHPLLLSFGFLCVALAFLTVLMRSWLGLGATTAHRYRLMQVLPWIFLYLLFLKSYDFHFRRFYPAILLGSLMVFILRFEDNLVALDRLNTRLEVGMDAFLTSDQEATLCYRNPVQGARILRASMMAKDYIPSFTGVDRPRNFRRNRTLLPMTVVLDTVMNTDDFLQVRGWAFTKFSDASELKIYGFVDHGGRLDYYETVPYAHATALIKNNRSGFIFTINKSSDRVGQGHNIGIGLRHPLRGIVAQSYMRDGILEK